MDNEISWDTMSLDDDEGVDPCCWLLVDVVEDWKE
jgi:hypothetical protein